VSAVVVLATIAVGAWLLRSQELVERLDAEWEPRVRTIAGEGKEGVNDGPAFRARFSDPFDVAVSADGVAIYVADAGEANRIRRIGPDGAVTTLAGSTEGFADGTGSAARFHTPSAVAVGPDGALYVADTGNHAIRKVTLDGVVTTLAGDGRPGWSDGGPRSARFNGPIGLTVDATGRVFVADTYNDRIRSVAPDGTVSTVAGSGQPGFGDGAGAVAAFDTPTDVVALPSGSLLVADYGNRAIRQIAPDGAVSTVRPSAHGITLWEPRSLTIGPGPTTAGADEPEPVVYVTDRHRVVELRRSSGDRVLAGGERGFSDGPGQRARFRSPAGLAVMPNARVLVADAGNRMIRALDHHWSGLQPGPAPDTLSPGFDWNEFARVPLLWPLDPQEGPHEVAGTLGEARGNPGGEGRERFHAGVDIRGANGSLVLAVRTGKVTVPDAADGFGGLSELVSIGAVTYVHVRVGRDHRNNPIDPRIWFVRDDRGRPIRARLRRGTRFRTGEAIGTVNRFNHVHLNIGPRGEEANALLLRLPTFVDTVPPTIASDVDLLDQNGRPFARGLDGRIFVHGRVQIVVDAYDRVDGNAARRRLGVFKLGYQVLNPDLTVVDGLQRLNETIVFDRLPPGPDAPLTVFASGSGIPFYGTRRTRFLYRVTARSVDGRVVDEPWDTRPLAPGDYVLRVVVADTEGNEAIARRDVAVTIIPPTGLQAPGFDLPALSTPAGPIAAP
jgi:DNA-binding beta-propeller fold protein YncE